LCGCCPNRWVVGGRCSEIVSRLDVGGTSIHASPEFLGDQRKPGLARTLALPGLGFEREPAVSLPFTNLKAGSIVALAMAKHGPFHKRPAAIPPAPQRAPQIPRGCRAARIGDITAFAECLAKRPASCPHRFPFGSSYFCEHPQRDAIIARTQVAQRPALS
jgi:hypothetical protein